MKVKHLQSLHFLQGYNLYLKYLKTVEKYKKYEVRCLKQFENICFRTGLPHTQGTQGIQGNSGNFQVGENLRETQGILIFS